MFDTGLKLVKKYKVEIVIASIAIIAIVVGVTLYFVKSSSSSGSPSPPPPPPPPPLPPTSDWIMNLYKTLNWKNAPTSTSTSTSSDNNHPVSDDWIKWALSSPNSIMQYYVNYRRTTQHQMSADKWPIKNEDIVLNPIYTWEGLATAVYIWNSAVQKNLTSGSPDKLLVNGFCDESDENLRKMTLAAFLANATVESAYFLVCKESTVLSDGTLCPGGITSEDPEFNPRYFNNCDQATPLTYSCQGGYPNPPIDPVTDNCTGGWPTCFALSTNITTDPCMTYPNGLIQKQTTLSNDKSNCTDWNGGKWKQQQECYFGRGLIQLTWSCNYFQVQNIFTRIKNQIINSSDPLLMQFVQALNKDYNDPDSINICANPDKLCGRIEFDKNYKVVNYGNIIDQAMPWLACIVYWCNKIPSWKQCYSFQASFQGIAPSGAGHYPDRLASYKFMLNLMQVDPASYKISNEGEGNVCLSTTACSDCVGGSESEGEDKYYCGASWDKANCNLPCKTRDDCPNEENCFAGVSCSS